MNPLATLDEFGDRIPGGVLAGDTARARGVLEDASALIRVEAGLDWDPDDPETTIPAVAKTVCISAAKRAFVNPEAVESLSVDGHAASFATGSPDVYLTKAEARAIRRAAGRSGLWTQATTRTQDADTDLLDTPHVQDGDELIDSGPLSDFFP